MNVTKVLTNATVATGKVSSNVYIARERPDQFGLAVIKHDGAKFSASTACATIEGSFDNTTWFVIDSCKDTDTEYANDLNGNNNWCKVVALAPYMRISVINGGSKVFNAWLAE
jgi:hypothetical protein